MYDSFQRFRLLDIARIYTDIMDVAMLCELDGCDADVIEAQDNITSGGSPREDVYNYKYVFDVGKSFSGRYLGLLKSGSLVFKVNCDLVMYKARLTGDDIPGVL
jgi:hypothetical protein